MSMTNEEYKIELKARIKRIIMNHMSSIKQTKYNHLDLADDFLYHKERYLIEKEKEQLLFDILNEIDII